MEVVPQILRMSSSSSSTITPILRTHLLAPGAATPDEDAEPAPGPARADADAERTRGSAGADTEAGGAARNIDMPSPSSSSSSYFVRPMQVPLAAYIAAEGRIDIQREMEEAGRRVFRFRPGELPRLAGIYWRRLSEVTKTAWKDRAKFLNSRDIPGELNSLPEILSPAVILRSVNMEIAELQVIFRSAILRQPKRDVSEHIRMFATERVQMATQTFRSFQMSLLLQLIIFGPNLSYLKADEIITRTKKTAVIHIHSCERIKNLFTVEDLCLLCVVQGGVHYTCAPKVFFAHSFGFVVDDDTSERSWRIHTNLQELINIPELHRLPNLEYDVENSNTVDEYWPIRIMIRGQKVFMTFSRVAFSVGEGSEAKLFLQCCS